MAQTWLKLTKGHPSQY